MGTSLSDKAWPTKVPFTALPECLRVVGGWFLTALSAFTAAFLIALLLSWGGMIAIIGMSALVMIVIIRTYRYHKNKKNIEESKPDEEDLDGTVDIIENRNSLVASILVNVSKLYYLALLNFSKEKRKSLKKVKAEANEIHIQTKLLKENMHTTIQQLSEDDIETGHYYVQVLDYLRETSNCLQFIVNPLFNHLDNNHAPLSKDQSAELVKFNEKMSVFFNFALPY